MCFSKMATFQASISVNEQMPLSKNVHKFDGGVCIHE